MAAESHIALGRFVMAAAIYTEKFHYCAPSLKKYPILNVIRVAYANPTIFANRVASEVFHFYEHHDKCSYLARKTMTTALTKNT